MLSQPIVISLNCEQTSYIFMLSFIIYILITYSNYSTLAPIQSKFKYTFSSRSQVSVACGWPFLHVFSKESGARPIANAIINVAQLPLSCLHEMATLNISVLHGYRNPPVTNLTFNFHYIDKHHRGKVVGKFGVGTRFTSFVYFTSFQLFKNVIYNKINTLSLTFVWILLTPEESTIFHI